MKRTTLFLTMLLSAATLLEAQTARPRRQSMDWMETLESPEITSCGDVTFRLFAPQANEVVLSCQASPNTPMRWDDDEQAWKCTIHPAVADIYPYSFIVDGQAVSDPNNRDIFPNELFKASLLIMPNPDMLYTERDVPHGKVHYCTYKSSVLGQPRTMLVYTPASYDQRRRRRYPVLYLVSGTTDTEETWYKAGRANFILDNLIADRRAQEMIIVMPYGNMNTGNPRPSSDAATLCYSIFAQEMERCVIPYVDRNFRTLTHRRHRAIAGFSRGGGEALFTAFKLPERFSSVCAYSAYLTDKVYEQHFPSLLSQPATTNSRYPLIWFGVGSDDFLLSGVRDNQALFRSHGVHFQQFDTTGGHTWMNARLFLGLTLPQLFR